MMHATSLRPVRGLTYSFDAPILPKKQRFLIPIPSPRPSYPDLKGFCYPFVSARKLVGRGGRPGMRWRALRYSSASVPSSTSLLSTRASLVLSSLSRATSSPWNSCVRRLACCSHTSRNGGNGQDEC